MRKGVWILAILIAVAGFAMADRATYDDTKTRVAMPFATPPTIDGFIDLAGGESWVYSSSAQPDGTSYWTVSFDENLDDLVAGGDLTSGQGPLFEEDIGFSIWVGYDSNNLYVAVRVIDDLLYDDTAAPNSQNGNTWEDDSVEVFIDGDNSNNPTRDTTGTNPAVVATGGQYVITINNAYREAEAGNPGFGPDKAWYAQTQWNETETGYDAEFRISLSALGNPKPGDIIGFTIAVNDDDDGGTLENQYTWVGKTHEEITYGNLVLGPRKYTAPKVTASPTIDGSIKANEYGTAPEIKINHYTGVYAMSDEWTIGDHDWSAWAVHDSQAIYVAVSVTDDKIMTDTAAAGSEDGSTWEDDSAEIFFDVNYDRVRGRGNTAFEGQYVLTPINAWRDNEANNPTFGANADWFAAGAITATGYVIEFKVTKAALDNPADGAKMGFDIAVNDDDEGSRKTQIAWNGWPHNEASYGELTLGTGGTSLSDWSLY